MQPRRRLTSRCSSPSSSERSSGEKESGSSTACGRFHEHTGERDRDTHRHTDGHRHVLQAKTSCPRPPVCLPEQGCARPAHGSLSAPTHHGERHPVNLVLVLRLVLPERAVPAAWRFRRFSGAQRCPAVPSCAQLSPHSPPEQLEEHAAQREPVGAAVVGHPLLQHLRRHVPVGAPGEGAQGGQGPPREGGRAGRGVGTLTRWRGASSWRSRRPGPGRRCGRGQTRPGGCLLAAETPGDTLSPRVARGYGVASQGALWDLGVSQCPRSLRAPMDFAVGVSIRPEGALWAGRVPTVF